MAKPIRLAIIGLGHIAKYQLQALQYVRKYELAGVCDIDKAKRTQIPDNIPFYTNFENMLDELNVDAVLISAPNKEHYPISKKVLQLRTNILLEKPATSSIHEFHDVATLAKSNNILLSIAFHAAFAKDLLWFLRYYRNNFYKDLGPITGFRCDFYDPYIVDGQLLKHAKSLGGSWMDSGINALSVIGQLVRLNSMKVEDSMLTRVPQYKCSEIQGTVHFTFSIGQTDKAGRGTINTSWTLSKNCKTTRLYFATKKKEILLHHSDQRVVLINKNGSARLLADCSNNRPRLVNHYVGVFEAFYNHLLKGTDNIEYSLKLHDLLFCPYK